MLPGSEPWCNDGASRTITVNGVLKTYNKPFSKTQHEALTAKDFVWIKWKDGKLTTYSDPTIAGLTAADFKQ